MRSTALIVGEDVHTHRMAATLAQAGRTTVECAITGSDACDFLCRHNAGAVVVVLSLDPGASGLNGWELLRRVNGRFGGVRLRVHPQVLAISTRHEPEVERFARHLGAHAFLCKPVQPYAFTSLIERLLYAGAAPTRHLATGTTSVCEGQQHAAWG